MSFATVDPQQYVHAENLPSTSSANMRVTLREALGLPCQLPLPRKIGRALVADPGFDVILDVTESGEWVVSDTLFYTYGAGDSIVTAFDDYCQSLAGYYRAAKEDAARNEMSRSVFEHITRYLREVHD